MPSSKVCKSSPHPRLSEHIGRRSSSRLRANTSRPRSPTPEPRHIASGGSPFENDLLDSPSSSDSSLSPYYASSAEDPTHDAPCTSYTEVRRPCPTSSDVEPVHGNPGPSSSSLPRQHPRTSVEERQYVFCVEAPSKTSRKRNSLTKEQAEVLHSIFATVSQFLGYIHPYLSISQTWFPTREMRKELASKLDIETRCVQVRSL